ncbi:MAG: hypothetical protein MUF33_15765 [Candidatus Nanopelagicales bacterium]|nr:hypothetical protein [Candidatus Nanopelagicales bacterium]
MRRVRTSELSPDGPDAPQAGEQLTVFDSEMREIGYWIVPLGFVRAEIVDAPGFDWKAELRRVNPDGADEILQQYGELP